MPLALVSERPLLSIGGAGDGTTPVLSRQKGGWYSKYHEEDEKGERKRHCTYLERQEAEKCHEENPDNFESVEEQEAALEEGNKERAEEQSYRAKAPVSSSVVDEVFARIVAYRARK